MASLLGFLSLVGLGAGLSLGKAAAADGPDYNREVRPILAAHCFACHGPDPKHREAGLRLDERAAAIRTMESGEKAIVPKHPDQSELIRRIIASEPGERMPPPKTGPALKPEEVAILKAWIESGAKYDPHWAFVAPKAPTPPPVKNAGWCREPLDRFILARLEKEGLPPNPEADRHALIRRLSLDLRGLPPSPAEVREFIADTRPDAYERLVDRFLADPAYGERMARIWLDLARYADSAGYGSDPLRPTMWRYRDWVIDAFNRNLTFDRFTTEQLAGDLLPGATLDQRLATAFHRNSMTNTEGGTDDEEFRSAAIKDRVDTTMQVWMGLTFGCAKCHTHKFDPITQHEYYRLYAFFNQTADNDQPDETPTLPIPTAAESAKMAALAAAIRELEGRRSKVTPALRTEVEALVGSVARPIAWKPIRPKVTAGTFTFEPQPDASVLVTGGAAVKTTYTLKAELPAGRITALRLEALPHDSLPGKGPGRSAAGNGVITEVRGRLEGSGIEPFAARHVRVELPGDQRWLALAEVEVMVNGVNVAKGKPAKQSSVDYEGTPNLAVDGNTDGEYFRSRSVTHTKLEKDPWWEVDLGSVQRIDNVVLHNRTDGGTASRLAGFKLVLLDERRQPVTSKSFPNFAAAKGSLRDGGVSLAFSAPTADFSQGGWAPEGVIDGQKETGWAWAPEFGKPHELVLPLAKPIELKTPARLVLNLDQQFGSDHTLGRFRLSVTDDGGGPIVALGQALRGLVTKSSSARSDADVLTLAEALRPWLRSTAELNAELDRKRAELAAIRPVSVPVLQELPPGQRRVTKLLEKGSFLSPGDTVGPGVPAAFHSPAGKLEDRLDLSRWLVDPRNPLTARVTVNRFWARFMGTGLVETEEDFGMQGANPTHPELLDHLAVTFLADGQDLKRFLKRLVTSATYRQSSGVRPDHLAKDPRNRLHGRSDRHRLEAEMIRDQALALAGLLDRKIGGPSVFPYQPPGLWQAAFNGERTWATSAGGDRHRRGIYTFWRRTIPYPSMATFDAPSRELCTIRRTATNTPLQAFVTLNDPAFVEAAQALGRRLVREGGDTTENRIRFGLELTLSRPATSAQVETLLGLYQSEKARYGKDSDAALKLATDPLGPLPAGLSPAEAAAWTVVANVLLNQDAVLTRN